MAEELAKKKRVRAGHRGMVTKRITEVETVLRGTGPLDEATILKIAQLKLVLNEKLETLKQLDKEIVDLFGTGDDIDKEIEHCDECNGKIHEALLKLDRRLTLEKDSSGSSPGGLEGRGSSGAETGHLTPPLPKTTKLPKLTLDSFDGDITKWKTFWDSYSSAIDSNSSLSDIDKFTYLQSLLTKTAKEAISGLALTSGNYSQATAILEKRFGDKQMIINKHMDLLLGIEAIHSSANLVGLRKMYDKMEANVRSLQALGVASSTYGKLLTSVLLKRLPPDIRLIISRQLSGDWSLEVIMKLVEEELIARERLATPSSKDGVRRGTCDTPTASALLSGMKDNQTSCCYCQQVHSPSACVTVATGDERRQVLRAAGRCYVCLRRGHISRNCRSKVRCRQCHGRHHISICDKKESLPNSELTPRSSQGGTINHHAMNPTAPPFSSSTTMCAGLTSTGVLLQTANALIVNPHVPHHKQVVSVIFDSGSQRSYVSERVSKDLQLRSKGRRTMTIMTFGNKEPESVNCNVIEIVVSRPDGDENTCQRIEVLSVPFICEPINQAPVNDHLHYLKGLPLADWRVFSGQTFTPDLLIGMDHYWSFVSGESIRTPCNGPIAMNSLLGWIISGPMPGLQGEEEDSTSLVTHVLKVSVSSEESNRRLERQLHNFWELESLGIVDKEQSVFEQFAGIVKFQGGRYEVRLPWKDPAVVIPDNYRLCLKRLQSTIQRLQQKPHLLEQYNEIIKDQLNQGIIEPVELEGHTSDNVHYLPHHAVIRQHHSTTKLRVVYDASAKCNGPSLNDCLHVGPKFNQKILEILMRFRLHKVIVAAGIEKAFLMIGVEKGDRDVLRFLWIRDIKKQPPEVCAYRFTRVMFGVACSPFLLNATLDYHLEKYRSILPQLVDQLKRSVYVDDVLIGATSVELAYDKCSEARKLLQEGGFNLRKFISNEETLQPRLVALEQNGSALEDPSTYVQSTLGRMEEGSGMRKVLGVMWDTHSDELVFDPKEINTLVNQIRPSKRTVISTISKFYDPLGIVSPLLTPFKIFLQQLCRAKINWDETLVGDLRREWEGLVKGLGGGQVVRVPRFYQQHCREYGNVVQQLQGFCDASIKAYAAVIYLVTKSGDVTTTELVCSKTRVAPLKSVTVPRLELLSAVLLARLMKTVTDSLSDDTELLPPLCYTDSKVSYYWIRGREKSWKPFIQNRVNEIRRLVPLTQWHHCPGNENPADLPSRGLSLEELTLNGSWFHGPPWLQVNIDQYSVEYLNDDAPPECDVERRVTKLVNPSIPYPSVHLSALISVEKYSNLHHLLRLTAYVLLFTHKSKEPTRTFTITDMVKQAEILWIREVQGAVNHHHESLKSLQPFVDPQGVWRCQGRFKNACLPYHTKFPILLPRDHHLTHLIVIHAHERVYHNGPKETLTELRSQYWIPKGRSLVQRLLHRCVICRRVEALAFKRPNPPPLPHFRVSEAPAFTHTGVDFAGPLFVKHDKSGTDSKVWLCLFTCCVTRGIHLELVPNLTTEAFLRCFRRFISRRGIPTTMVSDNGQTFKAAARVLNTIQKGSVQEQLTVLKVKWVFNMERAPWWGGYLRGWLDPQRGA